MAQLRERRPCATPGCERSYEYRPGKMTDMCRPCAMRAISNRPEIREKRRQQMKAYHGDSAWQAEHAEKTRAGVLRFLQENPEAAAAQKERARQQGLRNKGRTCPPRSQATRNKLSEAMIGHIPYAYRDAYRKLMRKWGIDRAEATRLILEEAALAVSRHHKEKEPT